MTKPLLKVEKVSLTFSDQQEQGQQQEILADINLQLMPGEAACLLGPSGCGKTSLLRIIAGFQQPSTGKLLINDKCIATHNYSLAPEQRNIGMVFQDYALFPHLTVSENIQFGIRKQKNADARIIELLALVGLSQHANHYPHQLSGGQQQRVALARALAPKPDLLLMDEPFSQLDVHLREHLASTLRQLLKQQGVTTLMVTHDQNEAFAFADNIGLMHKGVLVQWDSPQHLFEKPNTRFVGEFIGEGTILDANAQQQLGCPENINGHEILLRPSSITINSNDNKIGNAPLTGIIHNKIFRGERCLYQITVNDQLLLTSALGNQHYDAGSSVRVDIDWSTMTQFKSS